jgi:hypothetical protein
LLGNERSVPGGARNSLARDAPSGVGLWCSAPPPVLSLVAALAAVDPEGREGEARGNAEGCVSAEPIPNCVISPHAAWELAHRGLDEAMIRAILAAPEQRVLVRPGRVVLQSRVSMGEPGRICPVRVFVDLDKRPCEVVTAYRTSKISRYWREQP